MDPKYSGKGSVSRNSGLKKKNDRGKSCRDLKCKAYFGDNINSRRLKQMEMKGRFRLVSLKLESPAKGADTKYPHLCRYLMKKKL